MMKKFTYSWSAALLAAPFALLTMACSGGDETITAENVTLEECNDLFGEVEGEADADAAESEEMVEGDYDADGDADEDDADIEERCEELMAEDEAGDGTEEE